MSDVPSRWTAQTALVVAKEAELALDNTDRSMAAVRWRYEQEREFWNKGGPAIPFVEELVPTPRGDVRVRLYRPGAGPSPVIVYAHGGGYIVGSPATHDRLTRSLASLTGAVVVSIDYTLSPEARHPQPIEECAAVVQWVRASARRLGIVADDVSLAGDSAGAHIALATYLWLRDELGAAAGVRCLLLFYGGYGLRDSPSRRELGGPWDGMTADDLAWYEGCYISAEDVGDPYYDLLGRELSVPPCYVLATDLDPLLDDSRALAGLLRGSGHSLVVAEGVLHAFLQYARLLDDADRYLRLAANFFCDAPPPQDQVG
ncbi:alpha/beta hydrolase fold domain-containing protein [Tessaracoccus sp. OH4464_COT-324]|uniref:alpha/beta hydrolase fold domain-containing protein n=1 Tax=Tessaracoccus sp. OH4464_COT-324 TaxID=2491059 RepID=UPI000F6379E3|nr:alpha/beta hydrolase fold domain-containing protein [Tessaracoccus sp. OH4464_COT-324]RRD45720.1 acetylesterase [Tessaracoccus sp. OH4464_COT-324]